MLSPFLMPKERLKLINIVLLTFIILNGKCYYSLSLIQFLYYSAYSVAFDDTFKKVAAEIFKLEEENNASSVRRKLKIEFAYFDVMQEKAELRASEEEFQAPDGELVDQYDVTSSPTLVWFR